MTAIALVLLCGLFAACAFALLRTKNTADRRESFPSVEAAQAYALEHDAAGFDCFMRKRGEQWEVRCYRREPDADPGEKP